MNISRRNFLIGAAVAPVAAALPVVASEPARQWFIGNPYHVGGYVGGLKSGEYAAILQPGETIMPHHFIPPNPRFVLADHPVEKIINVWVNDERVI